MSTKQEFRNWMKNNPNRIYLQSTINRYVTAIDHAEEWLGIQLQNPIWDTTDPDTFEQTCNAVTQAKNYAEINRSHGHGDLSAALGAYKKFLLDRIRESDNGTNSSQQYSWFPSTEEYDPGISKELWLDLLNNPEIIGLVWDAVLAMFFTEKEGATCSAIGIKFNRDPSSVSGNCTQLAKKISSETGCPLYIEDGKEKYWPVLFTGKIAGTDTPGTWIWKLRPELYNALQEFDILRFLPDTTGASTEMPIRRIIDTVKRYIAAKGFTYTDGMIENYYLSLKSKPFVILAGTSGTGKTRLVRLFAEAIGATSQNGRYKLVPVRPDWSDSTDLFGYTDLNNRFHPGAILDFLKAAETDPTKPYFLCLDEMNLARVEYYLSDILSVIETREKTDNERIESAPLISADNYGGDPDAVQNYGTIRFPENLFLIGTVNMDETTFPFSKKVLDRANTIEFSDVDLVPDFEIFEVNAAPANHDTQFLKSEYLQISHCAAHSEYINALCESLQELNTILAKANTHVGYRVRDEICFYMLNNKNFGLLTEEQALDNEIMQKILPRIQGSNSLIRELLCDLFKYCAGDYTGYNSHSDYESMKSYLKDKDSRYRKSAEKIMSMVRRFDEDGFTSYWI